jgi:MoxR-like ATPase
VRCPLISAIGATNEVPADEVGEAFFDRFLVRIPVEPVSAEGFAQLLAAGHRLATPVPAADAVIVPAVREAIAAAAAHVRLSGETAALVAELRAHLAAGEHYVSDRRWVKIGGLLRTLAASEGRAEVVLWDLWLLPWCLGADAGAQSAIGAWLAARLGVREAFAPERVTRLVEAFEAQLGIEQEAEDIDYDAGGRLQFTNRVGEEVVDGKGAATAQRMTYTRRRRYGACHIAARTGQIDELAERLAGYLGELSARRRELASHVAQGLWIDPGFAAHAAQSLADTGRVLAVLVERAQAARDGFAALPRLPEDPGLSPEPIAAD